ncbi:hypothetical protein EI74_0252 [Mycoplasma testudineum]|uniref:Lipoprotein-associated protein n=1 Tax=Mycoplasma testudineum TaxID=244584 RepID=A0A4R6IH90_9MOLU|nr:hypothetical protein [Mycoplasma testudineum]OYD27027.1 hypothetical protein CG473_00015 [Mycoplasma testudineum]TDO21218.1 hypothetical protein EI74_0252 [Mycoplasma testudineum]
MKKRKLISLLISPLLISFIATISCNQNPSVSANLALSNIIKGISDQTINADDGILVNDLSKSINALTNSNSNYITKKIKILLLPTFQAALGEIAKIESVTFNTNGEDVSLKLIISYPNATSNQEVTFKIANLKSLIDLDAIFNNLNSKTYKPKVEYSSRTPFEWMTWIESFNLHSLNNEFKKRIESSFSNDLNGALITKIAVTKPNSESTFLNVKLTLSNAINEKQVTINIGPLWNQKSIPSEIDKNVALNIYPKLVNSSIVNLLERKKRATEVVSNLLNTHNFKIFEAVTDLLNL